MWIHDIDEGLRADGTKAPFSGAKLGAEKVEPPNFGEKCAIVFASDQKSDLPNFRKSDILF